MYRIISSFVLLSLVGCDAGRAWRSADSWYRAPEPTVNWDELTDADVYEVAANKTADADEQLRDVSCVELPKERAAEFAGQDVESTDGNSLYLVRGLYLNRSGSDLLVQHGSLGHSAVEMKRQALIVLLPRKPDEVFVTCSMAE